MPIIVLTTATGAPGASTTALGLTLSWPGPSLLVEADPAGTSLVPGWFRGAIDPHERNIVNLALVERADDLTGAIFNQALSIAASGDKHQRLALLGLTEPVQAGSLVNWWEPIGRALQSMSATGWAVIIDAGRLLQGSYPMPLLAIADQVLLVCRAELSDILRAYPMATHLKATLTGTGNADALGVLAIGNGGHRYYPGSAIAKQLGVQFALTVPDDPLSAAALSAGLARPPRLAARIRTRFSRRRVDESGLGDNENDDSETDTGDVAGGADTTAHPAGVQAYLTAARAAADTASAPDAGGRSGEDADPDQLAEVPPVVNVPAKLMRAYRAVARESAHRAEQRLTRLVAEEPTP